MISKKTKFYASLRLSLGYMLIIVLLYGCGYTNKSLISGNIDSIYIPIFENLTFRRGLEFDLTRDLKNEIMSKTNLRITNKDDADSILHGTIKNFNEVLLTQGVEDNIVESRVSLFVDIEMVDNRTGRTLTKVNGIRQDAEFIVSRGETLESATEEGLAALAKTIVNYLEEKW